jgi:hypothetical protein
MRKTGKGEKKLRNYSKREEYSSRRKGRKRPKKMKSKES